MKNKAISRFKSPLHRELLALFPFIWSGSNVIFAGAVFVVAVIVITAPHPKVFAGVVASNWYIGSIPVPFTFHLVLSNPAVSTIHSPQFWNAVPEEELPVGVFPVISRFREEERRERREKGI